MIAISCENGHIFYMSTDDHRDPKTEEKYVSQGCQVLKGDNFSFTPGDIIDICDHCQSLKENDWRTELEALYYTQDARPSFDYIVEFIERRFL